jgi:hypothetical protein
MDEKFEKKKSRSAGFADVDRVTDLQTLVGYLTSMNAAENIRRYKYHTFNLLNAREGPIFWM